jgi:hypothetical protein
MTRGPRDRSSGKSLFLGFFRVEDGVPRNLWGFGGVDGYQQVNDRAGQEMSRLLTGISGALALALISGAAQFASGRDLTRNSGRDLPPVAGKPRQTNHPLSFSPSSPDAATAAVNRGAKADRAAGPAGSPALMRTVSLTLSGFLDTTILVRIPVAAANPSAAAKSVTRKSMVACEPVVSVLTEVAKQLQPGRCVT